MMKLLFGAATAAAMMAALSPAFAVQDLDDNCKLCPSWRSDRSDRPPPVQVAPPPACRLIKQRIETRKGHAVYETRQVCG
jgi:hypothetical protein